MSVQRTPDRRGSNKDDDAIHWEEDLKPFSRLPREKRTETRQRVPVWVPGLISAALVAVACSMAVNFINRSRPAITQAFTASTPTEAVVTLTPTEEFPPTATPYSAPTETPIPVAAVDAAKTGGIAIGAKVKVFDTGTGLNFRKGPSRGAEAIKKLPDGTLLEVMGGPREAEGFVWWQMKDPDGTVGWGAQIGLQLVQ
jgi:hypothetical protein